MAVRINIKESRTITRNIFYLFSAIEEEMCNEKRNLSPSPQPSPRKGEGVFCFSRLGLSIIIAISISLSFSLYAEKETEVETLSELNIAEFEKEGNKEKKAGELEVDRIEISDLLLEGIIYSKKIRYALINGKIVKIGDLVAQHKVIKIYRDKVFLKNEEGVFKLAFY